MNELIKIMASDMDILPYTNELDEFYFFRVIYSALGLWCLKLGLTEKENKKGISKNAQSLLLHSLLERYLDLCPEARRLFFTSRNSDIAVFIRNILEQTGYLITLDNNCNVLNNTDETVRLSDKDYLYLGIPMFPFQMNGLGVHCNTGGHDVKLKDYLVRDNLTPEEYLSVSFNECDFEEKDINPEELEFFNPFFYGNVSNSWNKRMKSRITMARMSLNGPYYRVIQLENGTLIFADDSINDTQNSLTGREFRRLYIALKHYYDNPMQLLNCPIDEKYSYIRILGQLPNREYYYLLMNSWPKNNYNDHNNFIIRNELVSQVSEVLKSIGFTMRYGEFYG